MTTYYISPTGSDTNTGKATSAAWKTLTRLNTAFTNRVIRGGDSILLQCGGTWKASGTNRIRIRNVSTSAAAPLTIGSYGSGALPVIDGTGYGAYICGAGYDDTPVNFVALSNLNIRFTAEAQVVYIKNVHDWTIQGCAFNGLTLLENDCYNITIEGNDFSSTLADPPVSTLYIGHYTDTANGPHDILVRGNKFHDILGIWPDYPNSETEGVDVKNGTKNITFDGNTFQNIQGGNFITLRGVGHKVTNNTMDGAKGSGVAGYLVSGESGWEVDNNTIKNCHYGVWLEGPGNAITNNHFVNCVTPMAYAAGTKVEGNTIGDAPPPPPVLDVSAEVAAVDMALSTAYTGLDSMRAKLDVLKAKLGL